MIAAPRRFGLLGWLASLAGATLLSAVPAVAATQPDVSETDAETVRADVGTGAEPAEANADATGSRSGTDAGVETGAAAGEEEDNVPDAAKETTIHGGWYVIISYIVLWVLLFGYIVYLGTRQRELSHTLDRLEADIDETIRDLADEE